MGITCYIQQRITFIKCVMLLCNLEAHRITNSNKVKVSIFSYHLVEFPFFNAIKRILSNSISKNTEGLIHSEYMTAMTLGSPIFLPLEFF